MQNVSFAHIPGSAAEDESPPTEAPEEKYECGKNCEDDADDLRDVPVELLMEFLRALTDKDYQQAKRLCKIILIYDPLHPEASEFLPLIQAKLSEEEENQDSDDSDDSDSDGQDDDSEYDEELSSPSNEDSGSGEEKPTN
ncbi:glutamate-rich protein 2 isoform X1 [Syngnathus scovelli]|uniref:glutamate-rich protein 2 isoform X1 n=1 Tax=Syngnathus scovelli TaxID=161590 RepID=UPI00210FF986|nr:glutamate-rich protein 2 isoform X1 [Syngnathus scovelli]XP_049603097.1 glutamate-rich protein 2 isoform X1 [Syngnathus scovelli]